MIRYFRWTAWITLFGVLMWAALLPVSSTSRAAGSTAPHWESYDRPAQYRVVVDKDIAIPMRDGIVLTADVYRPDAPGRFPVILTQTPYNKNGALGQVNRYLVERGYVHVVVDVRGTGGSQGTWEAFGPAEQQDGYDLVRWASRQPWSNGKVGLWGASYMAINQFFTAALHPPGLKAMFPIVPMGDAYRDIMMSGGQANTGFIPLWMGLVTSGGLLPPTYVWNDPLRAGGVVIGHVGSTANSPLNTVTSVYSGGDLAYDGPFYRMRSPLEVVDRVNVPVFITGGLHDIFQRGEPLLYERLKQRVPTKLLIGNWTHGDFGTGLPADGVPTLDQIALRWFDRYLKGIDTHVERIPAVTQYILGSGHFETQRDWPAPGIRVERWYLREKGGLSRTPAVRETTNIMVQQPVNGICSGSTNQWTAGAIQATPCAKDNRLTEATEVTYTSSPLDRDLKVSGPIGAQVDLVTTAREAVISVRITDVAPDGTSTEWTAGWLAASLRKTDPAKSRMVNGELLQPWHPYTRDSVLPVTPGEPMRLYVEIFPTNGVLKKGHRLRVAIGPSDFPHAISPLPQAVRQSVGIVHILHGPHHPSHIALPVIETRP
jgi:predicted acyl esterase